MKSGKAPGIDGIQAELLTSTQPQSDHMVSSKTSGKRMRSFKTGIKGLLSSYLRKVMWEILTTGEGQDYSQSKVKYFAEYC